MNISGNIIDKGKQKISSVTKPLGIHDACKVKRKKSSELEGCFTKGAAKLSASSLSTEAQCTDRLQQIQNDSNETCRKRRKEPSKRKDTTEKVLPNPTMPFSLGGCGVHSSELKGSADKGIAKLNVSSLSAETDFADNLQPRQIDFNEICTKIRKQTSKRKRKMERATGDPVTSFSLGDCDVISDVCQPGITDGKKKIVLDVVSSLAQIDLLYKVRDPEKPPPKFCEGKMVSETDIPSSSKYRGKQPLQNPINPNEGSEIRSYKRCGENDIQLKLHNFLEERKNKRRSAHQAKVSQKKVVDDDVSSAFDISGVVCEAGKQILSQSKSCENEKTVVSDVISTLGELDLLRKGKHGSPSQLKRTNRKKKGDSNVLSSSQIKGKQPHVCHGDISNVRNIGVPKNQTETCPLTPVNDAIASSSKRKATYRLENKKKKTLVEDISNISVPKNQTETCPLTPVNDARASSSKRKETYRLENKKKKTLAEAAGGPASAKFQRQFKRVSNIPVKEWYLPSAENCAYCDAKLFPHESKLFCCGGGEIKLPPTKECPVLRSLFMGERPESSEFRRKCRTLNTGFSFTTTGMRIIEESWKPKQGIYALKVAGQVHHYFNPINGVPDKKELLQLFFLQCADELDDDIVKDKELDYNIISLVLQALAENPYAIFFQNLRSWGDLKEAKIILRADPCKDLRVHNLPVVEECAAVWRESEKGAAEQHRDIQVYTEPRKGHRIEYYYSCYDTLAYPLLFPYGEAGWHPGIKKRPRLLKKTTSSKKGKKSSTCSGLNVLNLDNTNSHTDIFRDEDNVIESNKNTRTNLSCRDFTCYRAQIRKSDKSYLLHAGRLSQQFIIDSYLKIETSRFDYFLSDQVQNLFRTETLQGITDSLHADINVTAGNVGKRIILPSSFIGGYRDLLKRYINAMTLVQKYGKPDLFITMTCNPSWDEITKELLPCEQPHDRPDLLTRVFRAKLIELKKLIVDQQLFGKVAAYVYVVEYQKRGLPHVHWIITLAPEHRINSADAYDRIISAEIPDDVTHPFLKGYVIHHMIHGPCGKDTTKACMRSEGCKYGYPKDFSETTVLREGAYPNYRRRANGRFVTVHKTKMNNQWVIPYNPYLLAKFNCHINVEICSDIRLVKYLYKYIYKGHDKTSYQIGENGPTIERNEIRGFQEGRYLSAPEAYWRIFKFPMSEMHPSVTIAPVHLPNHQPLRFGKEQDLKKILNDPLSGKSMLTEFFSMNAKDPDLIAHPLLYREFVEQYVWVNQKKIWKKRASKEPVVGRLSAVNPAEGARYFERILLMHVRGPTSFEDLCTLRSGKIGSFREAAIDRGLLEADDYAYDCLKEAALYQMPSSLRKLFALLLIYGISILPQRLWDSFYGVMSEDFSRDVLLSKTDILKKTVQEIDDYLISMDSSLFNFSLEFPFQITAAAKRLSKEYESELNLLPTSTDIEGINQLNVDQKKVYNIIISTISSKQGGAFFLDGPAGTGKTFLYRAILANVRLKHRIALAVATSGVAASLLPGGRTAHSRFKLPLDSANSNACSISKQSSIAKMIVESDIIIWDEATMANKRSIEALDLLLKDLCNCNKIFGGKVVLFGGDFRQTLPIVVKGSREATVGSSIVSSFLWPSISRLTLTENMRAKDDPSFTAYLLSIGNGTEIRNDADNVQIPDDILIPQMCAQDSMNALVEHVFPDMASNFDPSSHRAILTAKNDCVNEINSMLIEKLPGESHEYISYNKTIDTADQVEYEDYLTTVSVSSLPSHTLKLKVNAPVMLLRNLNPVEGLCNGTRLIIKELGENCIGAEISDGEFKGTHVFIPRIPLECNDRNKCVVPFRRTQFPIRLCFAMTINKAQGQTLDYVGIYLREPVFSHGQLYVALSRAKTSRNVKVLLNWDTNSDYIHGSTMNIVFQEVFQLATGTA